MNHRMLYLSKIANLNPTTTPRPSCPSCFVQFLFFVFFHSLSWYAWLSLVGRIQAGLELWVLGGRLKVTPSTRPVSSQLLAAERLSGWALRWQALEP